MSTIAPVPPLENCGKPSGDDCREGRRLLSVDEARRLILASVSPLQQCEDVPLREAVGRIAAANIQSSLALPTFDNAAMDGFCIHLDDLGSVPPIGLRLQGEARAGDEQRQMLRRGHTIRITTGAPVPDGVAAVVPHERARIVEGRVVIGARIEPGRNIRRRAEDVVSGATIVEGGVRLNACHLAILAAAGKSHVRVRRAPRVGILSTGNELVSPGTLPEGGRIVDTNRFILASMLRSAGATVEDLGIATDDVDLLARVLGANRHLDVIVTSGGVAGSVADRVPAAIAALKGETTVLSLALRPGKPIGFGSLGKCKLLNLPGNPMATLVTAFLFLGPLVKALAGQDERQRPGVARTAHEFTHVQGRQEFVPVRLVDTGPDGIPLAEKLGKGGSARLLPLAQADGLAELPASTGVIPAGQLIAFHSFLEMGLLPA